MKRRTDLMIDEIKYLYVDKKLSTYEIAKILNCHFHTIRLRLIAGNINRRLSWEHNQGKKIRNIDMDKVKELYYEQKLSITKIAKRLKCSHRLLSNRFNEAGIKKRPIGEVISNATFKGTPIIRKDGYVEIYQPHHPKARNRGYVLEHILIAEKALGKFLPPQATTHHWNGKENKKAIVVCQDNPYHKLLHRRTNDLIRQRTNCVECGSSPTLCLKRELCKGCYGRMYSQGLSLRKPTGEFYLYKPREVVK